MRRDELHMMLRTIRSAGQGESTSVGDSHHAPPAPSAYVAPPSDAREATQEIAVRYRARLPAWAGEDT